MKKKANFLSVFLSNFLKSDSESWTKIATRFLALVFTFFIIEKAYFRLTTLSFASYYNEFIYWEFLKKSIGSIYVPIVLLLFLGIFRKSVFVSWSSFEQGNKLRGFATSISFILMWIFTTYDYNYFFDQWHAWDRVLLVLMVILVYWKPIFILLYLSVLIPIIGQVEYLPGSSLAAPLMPLRILFLYVVFVLVKIVRKSFKIRDFTFLLGCIVGLHYFSSGFRKIVYGTDWIIHDKINYLLPATYSNGWLNFATPEWISMATEFLGNFNFPLKLFVLSIECGILFMFFNLKWMRYCLMGAIAMHIGILVYSGIFFWMWALILILTLYFFFNNNQIKNYSIFNKKYFIVSIVLIGLGYFWCKPVTLTWIDVPLTYTYKAYARTESGLSFKLPPKFFAPYDYQFTLTDFKYLNREKRLGVTWGAAGQKNGKLYNSFKTGNDLFEQEKETGNSYYNKELSDQFADFLINFVGNFNENSKNKNIIDFIRPPRLLMTFPSDNFITGNEKIIYVEIIESTIFYSKTKGYQEIRNKKILDLPIQID